MGSYSKKAKKQRLKNSGGNFLVYFLEGSLVFECQNQYWKTPVTV